MRLCVLTTLDKNGTINKHTHTSPSPTLCYFEQTGQGRIGTGLTICCGPPNHAMHGCHGSNRLSCSRRDKSPFRLWWLMSPMARSARLRGGRRERKERAKRESRGHRNGLFRTRPTRKNSLSFKSCRDPHDSNRGVFRVNERWRSDAP